MRTVLKSTLIVLSIVLLGFTLFTPGSGYKVGDEARDFNLKNVDGQMVSLKDYSDNKGVVVVFTCNTCPYSKMYEQRLIDLHNSYGPKGYPVVAINSNDKQKSPGDSFDEMVSLAKAKDYPFPYLYDDTQEIAMAYGATNTPHVYVLQKVEDKYKVAYIGGIDNNSRNAESASKKYASEAIDALLMGKEVTTTSTKAIGCTIKWK